MKISKIDLNNLRNDAHFQFHTEFRDLAEKHGAETLKAKPQFDAYLPLYGKTDEALKKIVKSEFTAKIHEADRARDEVFAGMAEINSGMCKHFVKNTAEAAQRLKIIFDTYGNIAKKTLNEETSAIYNFLQELRSDKYAGDTADAGLTAWADELENRNTALELLMRKRFDETAHRSDVVLKEARAELDKAYHSITERIDALAIVEGSADYETFIKTLNAVIAKYAVKLRRHRHSNAEAEQGEIV